MPRRDRDPRPPIEVIGGAPTTESLQDVSLGGGGSGGASRPRLRGWRAVAVGVVVLAALLALFTSDGGHTDAASSTTSTRRSTTSTSAGSTTSTTYVALGPLTGEPTGGVLVFVDQGRLWHVLDLDTGTIRDVRLHDDVRDTYGGVAGVRGGVVLTDGTAVIYAPLFPEGERRVLSDQGSVVLPSGRDDQIWVGDLYGGPEPPGTRETELRLLDLQGRVVARRTHTFDGLVAATEVGPLVSDGGQLYVVDGDGPRALGSGDILGSTATQAVVDSCDERARCVPALVDVRTGRRRPLTGLGRHLGAGAYRSYQVGADGDVVEIVYEPRLRATWVGPDGAVVAAGDLRLPGDESVDEGAGPGEPVLLPSRQGLVLTQGGGARLVVFRPTAGHFEATEIPLPTAVRFERILLIRP